ncbi:hypothetical protein CWI42_050860 [Ordospora colligata]|uniref:Uncharacterized protein n=1 Tax=Ordospora colligata OC4 TaxID=1354746 RepID=A0A0B2UKY5_9MICR|nr:uncharacterized protein M896_050890 [Ordospora colligata OC4]KHN69682.1 hypothetical protein M896_050890 [Ordospora colligata OC4]TBU15801.1 hypothetical protein CWI41_050880 [Ordospora colligata]TBU15929.1 hypothetical protein CWI40_050900 [Ordospora colligata]TBU18823.1 hypothetical protein CWI42_050860 [Ordospora colligata]
MEGIERDRELLRNAKRINRDIMEQMIVESQKEKKISYIGNLVASSKVVCMEKEQQYVSRSVIRNMSTQSILCLASDILKRVDRKTARRLQKIEEELVLREDLFVSMINHIERMPEQKDDLFSWYPGLDTCSMHAFVFKLLPDFSRKYKEYFVKAMASQREGKSKILDVFRGHLGKETQAFEVISGDLVIFEAMRCVPKGGLIVTSSYWCEIDERCDDALAMIAGIDENIRINDSIHAELFHPLCHAEVVVNGKEVLVSFIELNDLLTRNARSHKFWMDCEVVDEAWESVDQ